jgi:predicted RecA/RadA family phage recombinase
MPAKFIHHGATIDYQAPTDLPTGSVVVQGELVGVTKRPLAAGEWGVLVVEGVYEFLVEDLGGFSVGSPAYWSANDQWVESNNVGVPQNKFVGKVVKIDTRPGGSHVWVRLSQ